MDAKTSEKMGFLTNICCELTQILKKRLQEGVNNGILEMENIADESLTVMNALVTANIKQLCEISKANELQMTSFFIDRLLLVSK